MPVPAITAVVGAEVVGLVRGVVSLGVLVGEFGSAQGRTVSTATRVRIQPATSRTHRYSCVSELGIRPIRAATSADGVITVITRGPSGGGAAVGTGAGSQVIRIPSSIADRVHAIITDRRSAQETLLDLPLVVGTMIAMTVVPVTMTVVPVTMTVVPVTVVAMTVVTVTTSHSHGDQGNHQ